MLRFAGLVAALLAPAFTAHAEPTQGKPQVGDTYEITRDSRVSQRTSDGSSSSSSHDRDTIIERVIAARTAGMELEYDLPRNGSDEGGRGWQFPVRVLRPSHGPPQLLNQAELEARVDPWLKTAGLTRAACGRLIFTWNAFRIECDPQSAIRILETFDMGAGDLRDGAPYQTPEAHGPGFLKRKSAGPEGAVFFVEMALDPDAVRRDRAEVDVGVAQISGKSLSREAALQARSAEKIAGTISITFETDSAGRVRRRTKVADVKTRREDGTLEHQTVTETLERRTIARP